VHSREYSGSLIDQFPGTAGLSMVVMAFFILEVIVTRKHPDVLANPEAMGHLRLNIHPEVCIALGSSAPGRILDGEVWRLIAATFLHGNLIHLVMNLMALVDLGRICEPLLSTPRFLTTYLACGLLASLTSVAYNYLSMEPELRMQILESIPGSVGASGAICGLVGLLLGFSLRHRDRFLRDQILRSLVYIVLLSVVLPRIDHAGHLGGVAAGVIFGLFVPRYVSSGTVPIWRIPCFSLCALAAVSLGWAVWNHFRV
jgi:membrane associated rhomboid family serine protease